MFSSPPQGTYRYYGQLNLIALNVGYHDEHHDIPSVPWNRLPALTKAVPEIYTTLVSHRSRVRLRWKCLTDREISLFSRMVRTNRGDALLSST